MRMFLSLKHFHVSLFRDSNRKAKHAHDAVHRLVFPSYCATSIRSVVPEARTCGVEAGPVFLHDNTGDNVLERLAKLGQLV